MKFFAAMSLLAVSALLVLSGCENPEPEIDPSVPMGKDTDKFKPAKLTAPGGGGGGAQQKEEAKPEDSKANAPQEKKEETKGNTP